MLKNCFNLLLLILINNYGFSQSTISDSIIYTKSEDGTRILLNSFGVLNKKSGKIIIPKEFQQIQVCYKYLTNQNVFETDFFWVKKDNLWALYKKDRRLTEFKFLAPAYLSENLFPIKVGNKAGLIDTLGKEKLSFKYEELEKVFQGLILARLDSKWGVIDIKGNIVVPFSYNLLGYSLLYILEANKKKYVFSPFTKKLNTTSYDEVHGDLENYYSFIINNKFGYMDSLGNHLSACAYDRVEGFVNGFGGLCAGGKCGFINAKGKIVVPLSYSETGSFYNGRARVVMKDKFKWGFINETGKLVIEMKYRFVQDFEENTAIVTEIIKPKSMTVISNSVDNDNYENIGPQKMFVINKNGIYVSTAFDEITRYGDNKSFFLVKLGNKFGCINSEGKYIMQCVYDQAEAYFLNDRATFVKEGEYFYINTKGQLIKDK